MKKVAIIGSAGIPGRYGGFETLAQNLVQKLNSQFIFVVYCSKKLYNKQERLKSHKYAELIYLPLNSNGVQSILYDIISVIHAIRKVDVLLILGVSGCLILPFIKLFSRKKIITHIDGLEWKRSKWNLPVKLFLKLSEIIAIKYSNKIIADNDAIKDYIKNKYNLVADLIEYGGDQLSLLPDKTNNNNNRIHDIKNPYALTIARIEPENMIHIILNTFLNITSKNIVIIGNWKNSRYSKKLYKRYSHYSNIFLYHAIYDQNLLNLLRSNCEVYIHGHSAGGTNPALVETMYAGKPVIAYDVVYNRKTTSGRALYFKNSNDLANIIKNKNKQIFYRIQKHMKELAEVKYKWEIISAKYAELFS